MLLAPFARAQTGTEPGKPPASPPAAPATPPDAAAPTTPPEQRAPEPPPATTPAEPTAAPASPTSPTPESAGDGVNKFVVVDDREPEPPLIPNATDRLGGHFSLAAGAGVAFPFGKLQSGLATTDVLNPGWMFSLNAGIGVSRSLVLGVWGQYALYGSEDDCALSATPASGGTLDTSCDGNGFAVGPFVRYHLVQGLRYDPWVLAGLGYRKTTVSTNHGDEDFSGIEWLHLEFGGDWYPTSVIGFGPYLGFDWGIYGDHPGGDASSHFQLTTGLRINLDVPGK